MQHIRPALALVLIWSLLVVGCAPRPVTNPAMSGASTRVETVAFTTDSSRVHVLDVATSVLVGGDFTITLANERLGLVQTDYIPLQVLRSAYPDSIEAPAARLSELLMRVTVNAEQRGDLSFVQMKGSLQRISGRDSPSDRMIGLYWLERLGREVTDEIGVEYVQQLSDSTYAEVVSRPVSPEEGSEESGARRAAKAAGIVVAVLFALTLAVGAFSPSSSATPVPSS